MQILDLPIWIYVVAALLLNVVANVLIKKGALHTGSILFNPFTILGYATFAVVIAVSFKLLTVIDLAEMAIIMAANVLNTFLAGVFLFKEKTNRVGVAGVLLICLGIICFNLNL